MPPWPPGAATGVGSLPGTDPREAALLVAGELPGFAHVPELPERGPGADMLGRAAVIAADTHVDLQPSGWRLVARPGLDEQRARTHLAHDLDAVAEAFQGYAGPLKCQVTGPWTLAAGLELPRGDRALADRGAVRDLAEALAEGVARHVAELRRRVPGAEPVVQLDEPALPAVRAGRVPTASGFGRIPAVGTEELLGPLRTVLAATGGPAGIHCCAADPPLDLAARLELAFLSVDLGLLTRRADDALAELVERGTGLFLGVVPTTTPARPLAVREVGAPVRALWQRIGFAPERLAGSVVVTPACGLGRTAPFWARTALRTVREVGRSLVEMPEEREA